MASQAAAQRAAALEASRRKPTVAEVDHVAPGTPAPREKEVGQSQEKQLRSKRKAQQRQTAQRVPMEIDAAEDPLVTNDAWMQAREAGLGKTPRSAEEQEAEEFVRDNNL